MSHYSLRDINKQYIDSVLNFYIKEFYKMMIEKSESEDTLKKIINSKLEDLYKKNFISDWRLNFNLTNKEKIRDDKLDLLLNNVEPQKFFIEVLYRMSDQTFNDIIIYEQELKDYINDRYL